MPRSTPHNKNKVYFVGSGIASLAGAAFLIRDGLIPGDNIHILEELEITGGSLDGAGSADEGYVIRGGRMMEEHYVCTYDLFASIPSLTDSAKSVKDEIVEFSRKYVSASRCRLVRDGKKVDVSSFELSEKDRLDLFALLIHSEDSIGDKSIEDWFSPSFFEHNFWLMWATMFAFQPWHSAVELKRYVRCRTEHIQVYVYCFLQAMGKHHSTLCFGHGNVVMVNLIIRRHS
ncbi:oleate hydratase [Methylobacter tundripaludum]|uniref:oleate hydratase n=1 Tax=Methylobacter tundripaludum TaxID=173365 RepID=UPI000AB51808|nr:oleate hydratase [Methylobacter tundripaludum]